MNIEALCAAPRDPSPEAPAHSPSQMPLSSPVAPLYQRELHKDGGGNCSGGRRVLDVPVELELILSQMAQKPMLRGEVGARALRVRSDDTPQHWLLCHMGLY